MSSGLACVLSVELCYCEAARLSADGRSMGRACPELGAELAADLLKLSASLGLAVHDVARALLYATDPAPLPSRPDPYAGAVLVPFWVLEARRRAEAARLS